MSPNEHERGPRRHPRQISEFAGAAAAHRGARDEVRFGRPVQLKVFISSLMRGGSLDAERAEVASVIDDHPDLEAWMWERRANAGPYSSIEVCKGHAGTSDLLLLIVEDDLTDPTEAEWRAAKAGGAACAILVKPGQNRSERLKAFLAAERVDGIDHSFADLVELREATEGALRQSLTNAMRDKCFRRRASALESLPTNHLLEAGIDRAADLHFTGSTAQAAEVLVELEMLVPETAARPEGLELVSGLIHGAAGRTAQAVEAYTNVIDNPHSSAHAVATAHQNLSLEAMRIGDLTGAAELMRDALDLFRAIPDWFGILQVVLNLGTLEAERGDLGSAEDLADLAEQLVGEFDQPLLGKRASIHGLRGLIAAYSGRFEAALGSYKTAFRLSSNDNDSDLAIVGAQNIGAAYHDLGRYDLALRWAKRSLDLAEAKGNALKLEEIYRLLGIICAHSGRTRAALDHLEAARAFAASVDDDWREATLRVDIGALRTKLGDSGASADFDAAYATLERIGDLDWLHRVDLNRAAHFLQCDDEESATSALLRVRGAPTVRPELRRNALGELARIKLEGSDGAAEAIGLYLESLDIGGDLATVALEAASYSNRLRDHDRLDDALELADKAVSLAVSSGDAALEFDVRNDRALLLVERGQTDEAQSSLENCVQLARTQRDRDRRVQALTNLAEVARRNEDLGRSITASREAITSATQAGDGAARRTALGMLAMTQNALAKPSQATRTARKLLAECDENADRDNASVALGVLGSACFQDGQYVDAARWYRLASRSNKSIPVQHGEDLQGIAESHAAAGRWRPALRAVQNVVTHAQENDLQRQAWPSLLRAAKWFLDREECRRAATITVPAWVMASQTPEEPQQVDANGSDQTDIADTQFIQALVTSALHELWSKTDRAELFYEQIFEEFDLDGQGLDNLRAVVADARAAARDLDSRDART